jgi:hypothetical protein
METKVDLDTLSGFEGATLPAYSNLGKTMSIPSKTVLLTNSASGSGIGGQINLGQKLFKIPFGNIIFDEIKDFNPESSFRELGQKYESPVFENNIEKIIATNYSISSKFQFNFPLPFSEVNMNVVVELSIYDKSNNFISSVGSRTLNVGVIYDGGKYIGVTMEDSINKDNVEILSGNKLCATITINSPFSESYSTASASCSIVLKTNSKIAPTGVKTFAIHESLSRVAEAITDNSLTVKSDYYGRKDSQINPAQADGVGSLRCITNGYFLRRTTSINGSAPSIYISLKDILDGLNAIDAIGYSVEDDKLRIEPWEYFYTDNVILRCHDISEIKRKIDVGKCFQLVDIGYDKWEAEEWNGIDGFHGKRQYRTKLKNSDTKSEQFCKFIADSYAIEATRRKGLEDNTKDWRYDNNIFIIDLIRNSDNSLKVNTGDGNPSTLIDPGAVFNVDLSPARMAARWFGWVMQGVNPSTGDLLIFAGAEGYADAITTSKHAGSVANGGVLERQNWEAAAIINRNPIPKFKPELVEFEYPLTAAEFIAIRNNPSGLIEFDGEYGWIREIEADLLEGTAKFTLMPKR